MNKLKSLLASLPVYLYLLPLFYVFHGFNDFFFLIPVSDALELVLVYSGCCIVLVFLFWLIFRSFRKASLMAFCLMAFGLFYGSIHDFLKDHTHNGFFSRYSFLIPFSSLLFLALFIYLKKKAGRLSRITQYLNVVLLVLFFMELGILINRLPYREAYLVRPVKGDTSLIGNRDKPDIFFILTDEYAGHNELLDIFHYDNSRFEDSLKSRGFHVVKNSSSNYNWTLYSMASMLNMDYLKNLREDTVNNYDMMKCADAINNNNVVDFLKSAGYDVYNCSIFDVNGQYKLVRPVFLPEKKALITTANFPNRWRRDIGFHFATEEEMTEAKKRNLNNNTKIEAITRDLATQSHSRPRFIYSHLAMPHYNYYFDSNGKAMPKIYLEPVTKPDKQAYLQYLVYTNKKLLDLADFIMRSAKRPPVIIIMSDHGFRSTGKEVDKKYHYMTLNSVYFPNGNYSGFYDGMTNINQFPVILNTLFGQKFPLVKDSAFYIKGD